MKHLLSATALLFGSALAHAQTAHWTFTYTGFYDHEACQAVCPVECCLPDPNVREGAGA